MIISRERDDLSFDEAVKLANELNLREPPEAGQVASLDMRSETVI